VGTTFGARREERMIMRTAAVIVPVVLGLAGVAAAQPALTPPVPQPLPPPAAAHPEAELSEGTALMLSLGGTAAAYGLIVAGANANSDSAGEPLVTAGVIGTFFAPSFGHWYAHSFATRGMAIRGLATAGMVVGAMVALSECPLFSEEPCDTSGADILIVASFIAYAAGTVDDIMTAPAKARAYNRRGREPSLAVMPVARRDSGGLALVGTF
jgi:hypothetical protein